MSRPRRLPNSEFRRVLGDELRRARTRRQWTRKQFCERVPHLALQTLASYELGSRPCTTECLYELCEVLGVFQHDLLARVRERLTGQDDHGRLLVDLDQVLRDKQPALQPLRRWARQRLADADQATIHLELSAVAQLAEVCRIPADDLTERLRALTSPSPAAQVLTPLRQRPILESA